MWTNRQLRTRCLPSLLVALTLSLCLGNSRAQTKTGDGRYSIAVGRGGQISLEEYEQVKVDFRGAPADYVGVSLLQCTGEKPQEISVRLATGGEMAEVENVRPGCLRLMRPYLDPKKEEEVCVFPEVGYGLIETKVINSDAAVDPKNVVLTMANEGNATTTIHFAMFTEVVLPETSSLVIYDEATPDAEIVGFVLNLDVNFGWNNLEFCIRNECVIDGYLLDYYPAMPAAYICYVESQAEHVYQQPFRGGTNELSAELDLPDDNPYVVTFILSHNATPNSTSPLLAINQEIVYQALISNGEILVYPATSASMIRGKPTLGMVIALVIGAMGLSRWMLW